MDQNGVIQNGINQNGVDQTSVHLSNVNSSSGSQEHVSPSSKHGSNINELSDGDSGGSSYRLPLVQVNGNSNGVQKHDVKQQARLLQVHHRIACTKLCSEFQVVS